MSEVEKFQADMWASSMMSAEDQTYLVTLGHSIQESE